MKMRSNKVQAVIDYYRQELKELYDPAETENFLFFSAEHILGFSRADLLQKKEQALNESTLLQFIYIVKDLKKHKPIQYILGNTEFYGLKLEVNPAVLIPRQETEELVDLVIRENKNQNLRVLDIGTGSGCIAIALKKNMPRAEVYGLDVSAEALQVASANAKSNAAEVHFIKGDALHPEPGNLPGKFDIMVSNPPYITSSEQAKMDRNVVEYEPHLALFVPDTDPLVFYRKIAELAAQLLNPGGKLYFEVHEDHGEGVKELLLEKGYQGVEVRKDINGKNRIVKAGI